MSGRHPARSVAPRPAALGVALVALAVLSGGCGFAVPWPATGASPPTDPHHVLVFGDSLMGETAGPLADRLAARGVDATVLSEHVNGSGLASPILGLTPDHYVADQLDANPDTDTVVFMWSGACARPCPETYGSPEFYDAWFAEVAAITKLAQDRGLHVLWASGPPSPPTPVPSTNGVYEYLDDGVFTISAMTRSFAITNGISWVSWWSALCAEDGFLGHYDKYLWYDGAVHQVRAFDDLHLSADGGARTAYWTEAALEQVWAGQVAAVASVGG
jgi:hypothetical protein